MLYRMVHNQITPFTQHVGHNIPESKGGETTINNLFPACAKCKLSMSNKYTIEEWVGKFE
jgi:5-methylcytosine-specific restriction endonuclease McrA